MDVAVIGGGFSGLYAAWRLAPRLRVDLFEAAPSWGGLAAPMTLAGRTVERYYHFICRSDRRYLELIAELGLAGRLRFCPTRTGFFHEGRAYDFSTPLDLLRFTPLGVVERLRFGAMAAGSRLRADWGALDRISAREWLLRRLGRHGYETVWEPLLKMKFGDRHGEVSTAWIWHRIHRVARSRRRPWGGEVFGALEGGTALVIDRFLGDLRRAGAGLHAEEPVTAIHRGDGGSLGLETSAGARGPFRAVLSTVPFPVLSGLVAGTAPDYSRFLGGFAHVGVRCLALLLERPLSPYFWLNVHDARVPFNGIIELSNLVAPPGGGHLAYVPAYVPPEHPLYRMPEAEFRERVLAALPLVSPGFDRAAVLASEVGRDRHAQPLCPVGTGARIPGTATPVPGLHAVESFQIYPEDRTLSGMAALVDRALPGLESSLAG